MSEQKEKISYFSIYPVHTFWEVWAYPANSIPWRLDSFNSLKDADTYLTCTYPGVRVNVYAQTYYRCPND